MKQNACWSSTLIFTYARNFRVTCNYKTNVNASTLMSIGFNVHGETHRSLRASIRRLMRVRQKIGWTLNHEDEGMRVAAVDVPAGISASGSSSHRHRRSEVPGWWSVVSSEIHRAHDTPHIASASITRAHTRQGATSTSVGSPGGTAYPSPLSLSRSPSSSFFRSFKDRVSRTAVPWLWISRGSKVAEPSTRGAPYSLRDTWNEFAGINDPSLSSRKLRDATSKNRCFIAERFFRTSLSVLILFGNLLRLHWRV